MANQKIKCVIWDLDNTVWAGVLIEDKQVCIKDGVEDIIKALDKRGILQSISSKNDYDLAKEQLVKFGLWEYFIYPQINWNRKSDGIGQIAKSINIGIDTLAFIDDQPFEREEVNFVHPEVLCIDAGQIKEVLEMDRMMPKFITEDSKNRRKMYQSDIIRNDLEKDYEGTTEEFLMTLGLELEIDSAQEVDLQRLEELTVRTHQLNSTGYVYGYDELKELINSKQYDLLAIQLKDKYGEYGKIGLALVEKAPSFWEIKLLLMSCRVMSKGIGNVVMNTIMNDARKNNVALRAQFIPTDRNRIMYITYKLNGFREVEQIGEVSILEADLTNERVIPKYVKLVDRRKQ